MAENATSSRRQKILPPGVELDRTRLDMLMPVRTKPPAPSADEEKVQALVRRVDEDRWLASRFAPAPVRAWLIGLYALNYEVSRTAEAVREPAIGDIRLRFWREALDAIYRGAEPPRHPAAEAAAIAIREAELPRPIFESMLDARGNDFDEMPFVGWPDLEAYVDATAGNLMRLSMLVCMPGESLTEPQEALIRAGGRAWGYCGLVRVLNMWAERRRTFFPKRLLEHVGLSPAKLFSGKDDPLIAAAARAVLDRATENHKEVRRLAGAAPKEAFPACGYLALLPNYIRLAAHRAEGDFATPPPSLLRRQVRLVLASASGNL